MARVAESDNDGQFSRRRETLQDLWDNGIRDPRQLMALTAIPRSTLYRNLDRLQCNQRLERVHGSGKPRALSAHFKRVLVQTALMNPQLSSETLAVKLVESNGPRVSGSTVYRELKASGIRKIRPSAAPNLSDRHKKLRVKWAIENRDTDWSRVVFTDESYFSLYRNTIRLWSKSKRTKKTPKFGPTIVVWGGISLRGTTTLCLTKGSINALRYQEILSEHMTSIFFPLS